jgi:hypothetical protein
LLVGEILYTTANGTQYLFIGLNNNFGVIYSINQEQKTLPLNTINAAFEAFNIGAEINAQWYINYNQHEYKTRPCNLSVLNELLARI